MRCVTRCVLRRACAVLTCGVALCVAAMLFAGAPARAQAVEGAASVQEASSAAVEAEGAARPDAQDDGDVSAQAEAGAEGGASMGANAEGGAEASANANADAGAGTGTGGPSAGAGAPDASAADAQDDGGAAQDGAIDPANLVNPQQLPDSSFIYDALISDLEKADSYMDGQTVQVTGEVVGDRIVAEWDPANCWLTVEATDGSYAEVSVYVSKALSAAIDTYGAYGKKGTVVQVRGTFHLACSEHEGATDLHADHLSVVSKGSVSPDEFDLARFVPGVVLILVGLIATLVLIRMREGLR